MPRASDLDRLAERGWGKPKEDVVIDDHETSGFRIVFRQWPEGYDPLSKGERPTSKGLVADRERLQLLGGHDDRVPVVRGDPGHEVGRFFCQACIARRLGLNIGTAQKAVWRLVVSSGVGIDGAACSECGQRGLVVGPGRQKSFADTAGRARRVLETKRESRSVPSAKAIVEHITTALAEDAICARCLTGHAGVPIDDVIEQVQRVSAHIRITTKPGNCPECGRWDTLLSFGGGQ